MHVIAGKDRIGLCSTCNNSTTCVYRVKRGFDAMYCDMFDCHVKSNGHEELEPVLIYAETAAKYSNPAQHRGLCANCENRESCVLPQPDEGVWHCEEYT